MPCTIPMLSHMTNSPMLDSVCKKQYTHFSQSMKLSFVHTRAFEPTGREEMIVTTTSKQKQTKRQTGKHSYLSHAEAIELRLQQQEEQSCELHVRNAAISCYQTLENPLHT